MYLNLGQEVIKKKDIVGIFDLDSSTVSKITRDSLSKAEAEKKTVTVSFDDLPRSFIIESSLNSKEHKIYISQLSHTTLIKRTADIF